MGDELLPFPESLMIPIKEDLLPMMEKREKRKFLPCGVTPDNVIWLCNVQRVPKEKVS
jgi:hypothetical protein